MAELIKLTKQAQQQAATFADEQQRGMIRVVAASRQVTDAIDEQTASLKKSAATASQTTQQTGNDFKDLESRVSNFQKLLIAAFTLSEFKSFATDVLDAKTKLDSLKISLDVMLGSKRQSMELMADMVKLAKTLYSRVVLVTRDWRSRVNQLHCIN
ncbi:hypothetical protein [Fibrivirga algicola]|uniref:Uncharacterized protein n=1 Tax=Fibrivirga algicola TaxID=2950420 RepID=A0ABX0QDR6_9BACT|nr:hypothetical protein [Fibrivirga algicola]NID09396.1 hypothetical protein [Fibrivirga algicola]